MLNRLKEILNHKILLSALLLLIINLGMVFYYYDLKTGTHIDENFSYAHANSSQGAYLSKKIDAYFKDYDFDVRNKWHEGKVFKDYMTTQKDEAFKYDHIWENMKNDVHPPLYYILLHTVCSFFIDSYSKWYGAGINICLWMCLLVVLFNLSNLVLKNKYLSLITVSLYAFSQIGLDTVLYIRMYALQTLLLTLLVLDTLKLLSENKRDIIRLFKICLWSFLGAFTQYSSILFAIIVCFVASIVLCYRKNWYLLAYYILAVILGISFLFILFPFTFDVLLFSQRGAELFEYMANVKVILARLSGVFDVCTRLLLSFSDINWRFLLLLFVIIFFAFCKNKEQANVFFGVIFGVAVLIELYLSYTMPLNYATGVRYQMPIMPLYAVVFVNMAYCLLLKMKLNKNIVYVILCLGVLINSIRADFGNKSPFRFQNDEKTNTFLQEIKGKKVIIATVQFWTVFEHLRYLMDVDEVYPTVFPCDYPLRKMMRIPVSGTYFVYFNKDAEKTNYGKPNKNESVCANLGDKLDFLYTVSLGERYYDVYKVK